MRKAILTGAVLASFVSTAHGAEVTSRTELVQTGESARVNSPECAGPGAVSASDILLRVGAGVIDKYTGYPFATVVYDNLPDGNKDWVKGRLGIHNGKSSCSTLCVTLPNTGSATTPIIKAGFSETGGDGASERTADINHVKSLNGDYSTGWAGVIGASLSDTNKATLFCATGKNWSHNRNRWFWIQAQY